MKLAEFIKIVDGENAYFSSRLDSIINESMPASHADERVNDFLSDLFFAAYNKLVLPVKLKSIYCVVSTIFMLAVSYMLSAFFVSILSLSFYCGLQLQHYQHMPHSRLLGCLKSNRTCSLSVMSLMV